MNNSILNVLIITVLLMLAYGSFTFKKNSYQFLSMQHTNVIKGIAILTVIWGHSTKELEVNHIQFIAAVGVFLFLFCSGYGCYLSYLKKGLKGYWKRKILKIFIPFWVIEFIGLNVNGNFEWGLYLQDCTFLKPATAYGWFMGFLLIYYLLFWITCRLKDRMLWENQIILYIMIIVSMIWLILDSVFWASPFMPELKARQMMAFPIGILFAIKRKVYSSPRITNHVIGSGIVAICVGGGVHSVS